MKIINRLYLKVIIITVLMLALLFQFYSMKNVSVVDKKIPKQDIHITKIKTLQKEVETYKKEVKYLKEHPKVKIKIKKIPQKDKRYKKMMMYNIHHQILQELKYAPYLPVNQLQTMMDKRFVLDGVSFKISLKSTDTKFDGIKVTKDRTISVVRDSLLLEVKFVDKR